MKSTTEADSHYVGRVAEGCRYVPAGTRCLRCRQPVAWAFPRDGGEVVCYPCVVRSNFKNGSHWTHFDDDD